MQTFLQDLRYALRQLKKNPGFTIVAVLTLALGIGANTAIFSVLNALILRPLPYPTSSRLVWITQYLPRLKGEIVGTPDFLAWRDQSHSFSQLAAYDEGDANLTGGEYPERIHTVAITASLFPLLGVQPASGRAFRNDENNPGTSSAVILSYGLWQRRFSADPSILGTKILLDGSPHEVVGIMPASFVFPNSGPNPDILMPLSLPEHLDMSNQNIELVSVLGQLRPGVSIAEANAELSAIQHQFVASAYPSDFKNMVSGFEMRATSLHEHMVGDVRHTLFILLAAVGFLLLMACANTANLQLAKATVHGKELGIRAAIGASRYRLTRQLLTESLLVSLFGGVAGIAFAYWSIHLLHRLGLHELPQFNQITLDYWVLAFAFLIAILSGTLSGLAPAVLARKSNPSDALKDGSHTTTEAPSVQHIRKLLVISEISLAVILLVGAGLFIRSFLGLLGVDPGFNPHNLLTLQVSLPEAKYTNDVKQREFFSELVHRLSNLPGVIHAGAVSQLPLTDYHLAGAVVIEGQTLPPQGMRPMVPIGSATSDYFRTMGIPLIQGRYFDSSDAPSTSSVVLVSHAFAKQFFGDENPVGKRVQLSGSSGDTWMTIVGVVGDVHHLGLQTPPSPEVFRDFEQGPNHEMTVVLRTAGNPLALISAVRHEVLALDNEQPIYDVASMEQRMADSIAEQKFDMWLLTAFGVVALTLAIIAIYGIVAFYVAQRTHEIGIRIAVGAEQQDILQLILRHGLTLTIVGVVAGICASLLLTRFLSNLLFGISANDTFTFASVTAVLTITASVASYIPARRAAKVDPMVALRYE